LNEIQEPNKFFWISEMALFQEFRDEKTFKGFMNLLKNYDYIFIDELFAVENWKDSNADRDKATITHRNNFTFWDTLTNDSSKKVFCTTNQVFGLFKPNTASERIIERIKEICEIMEIN
jgi:DNA replication protein DnaC